MQPIEPIVCEELNSNHFLTSEDLKSTLHRKLGVDVSLSTVARCRKRGGFRYKLAQRSQQHQRADPSHPFISTRRVLSGAIAVDESCFVSSDRPRRGWARPGHRVPKHPPKARKTVSLLLAIDESGIVAMDHKHGAYNSKRFSDFIQTLPTNRRIVLDNVAFHKSKLVREAAKGREQELVFTPPYCPWFNPVEFAFSVSKLAYRRSRLSDGTDFVHDALVAIRREVNRERCESFFRHAESNVVRERR